jgi:hypothetical protein
MVRASRKLIRFAGLVSGHLSREKIIALLVAQVAWSCVCYFVAHRVCNRTNSTEVKAILPLLESEAATAEVAV